MVIKMNDYVTIKVSKEISEQIKNDYSSYLTNNNGEYVLFSILKDGLSITAYTSKKETITVTFKGATALESALKYDNSAQKKEIKEATKTCFKISSSHIGSDEVGVGDFFGPIVVVAAYVDELYYQKLLTLGIDDSKKLSDKKILEIGPSLLKDFKYSLLICYPDKYNEMINKGFNMNKIKAWLHNHALLTLKRKYQLTAPIFVDQFCSVDNYYKYLIDSPDVETNITFLTKAESYYPSVALASCIARYTFLKINEEYNKKYGILIPFGASKKVTDTAIEFVHKYNLNELNKIIKINFKNYLEVLDNINSKNNI